MYQTLLMDRVQSARRQSGDFQGQIPWQHRSMRPHQLGQILAFDVLHDEEQQPLVLAGRIDSDDVLMIDQCRLASLLEEAFLLMLSGGVRAGHLQRDTSSEREILGLVNLRHAAPTEESYDAKRSHLLTRR